MSCVENLDQASEPIADAEDLYRRLEKFIWWRAHQMTWGNTNHVLLDVDDVAGEMFVTLVECWEHYKGREDIDADAMLRIVRSSCDKRCNDLTLLYYYTQKHSGDGQEIPLDEVFDVGVTCDVESIIESKNKISAFLEALDDDEYDVVVALLKMDPRIARTVHLDTVRKEFVHPYGVCPVRISSRLIADALHLSYSTAYKVWRRIREKWFSFQEKEQ